MIYGENVYQLLIKMENIHIILQIIKELRIKTIWPFYFFPSKLVSIKTIRVVPVGGKY